MFEHNTFSGVSSIPLFPPRISRVKHRFPPVSRVRYTVFLRVSCQVFPFSSVSCQVSPFPSVSCQESAFFSPNVSCPVSHFSCASVNYPVFSILLLLILFCLIFSRIASFFLLCFRSNVPLSHLLQCL